MASPWRLTTIQAYLMTSRWWHGGLHRARAVWISRWITSPLLARALQRDQPLDLCVIHTVPARLSPAFQQRHYTVEACK